jgi:hypothetical protein
LLNDAGIWRVALVCFAFLFASSSCNAIPTQTRINPTDASPPLLTSATAEPKVVLTATPMVTATLMPSPTFTALPSSTHTQVNLPTSSNTPTALNTPTGVPISTILRGVVLQRANCRYGPGAPYLYKYGLLADTPMDIIGRNDLGTWLLIQAHGGDNPCWIKASLMEVQGDVLSAAPTYIPLPLSPYYGALSGVAAVRKGDEVIVSWQPLSLRSGDEVDFVIEAPYIIEAWVCQDGKLVFIPVGAYTNLATIRDEAGCSEASHVRIYGAEKHGYTPWVEIPWPSAAVSTPDGYLW